MITILQYKYFIKFLSSLPKPLTNSRILVAFDIDLVDLLFLKIEVLTMLSKILSFLAIFALLFMFEIPSQAFIDYGKQTLIGDDFSSQDLRGATFYLTDLQDANLSESDLEGASLFGAKLLNTDLSNTNLRNATLDSADFEGTNLSNAILEDAFAFSARFKNVDITGTDFTNVIITGEELTYLCSIANGTNTITKRETFSTLECS